MPFTTKRYGWICDIPDQRDHLYAAPGAALAALPAKIDLRRNCPAVYDQGQLGSCTANGIAGAIQYDRMKQNLKPDFTPSRLFIYYNERVIEGTVKSDSGAQIRDGIKVVAKEGDCPETEWPYVITKFTNKPTTQCYKDALKYKAVQYQRRGPECESDERLPRLRLSIRLRFHGLRKFRKQERGENRGRSHAGLRGESTWRPLRTCRGLRRRTATLPGSEFLGNGLGPSRLFHGAVRLFDRPEPLKRFLDH